MGRDDLYITVPSLFRCPISLDVMTSPVSLSTGVTYDRSSIQTWLDGGHNTCPATMQVLSSTDLVPNLTLRRLIRIWSDSSAPPPPPPPPDSPLSRDAALALANSLSNSTADVEPSMSRLARFAAESEDNSIFLAKIDGFPELLLKNLMSRSDDRPEKSINCIAIIVRVLEPVLAKSQDRETLINSGVVSRNFRRLIGSLQLVIERGSVESKIAVVKILESVIVTEESKLVIAESEGYLGQLLRLICSETEQNLIESTLSFLIHLAGPKRARTKLLGMGAVESLSELLAAPGSAVSVIEKALRLLAAVSSCREGREALSREDRCVEVVLQRAFKVSAAATEHAVAILWGLCYGAAGDERPRAVVRRCNGVARLLVVMQSGCSPAARRMCGDLLRVFRVSSRSQPCLSNYDTKTTHIMPF